MLKITYRDIYSVNFLEKNFKRHALDEAEASIRLRGFIDPVGYNPKTSNVFDGNGRIEALRLLHAKWERGDLDDNNQPYVPPKGIKVNDKVWLAPTIDVEMTADEEVAAAAAINQINKLGGYDEAFQLEILQELQEKGTFQATGFTDADLQDLLKRFPPPRQTFQEKNPDAELRNIVGDGVSKESTSQVKQVYLFLAPEKYPEYKRLIKELADPFKADNETDVVFEALQHAERTLKTTADSV